MRQWFQRLHALPPVTFRRALRDESVTPTQWLRPFTALTLSLLLLMGGLLGVASYAPRAHAEPAHKSASHPFVAMGFAIGYQMPSTPPWGSINQEDLFALQTTNGTGLDTSFVNGVNIPAFVSAAHAHNVQALITIGGSSDQNWQYACTGSNRAGFVSNLVNYMQSKGFDGIDLDIEDDQWAAVGPPDPDMTACIEAISTAAKAVKTQAGNTPIISADEITNWEGSWFAPSQAYVDQFNLMTYGDTCTPSCSSFASDVSATVSQGLPASKLVLGIDVIDNPPPAGDCGAIANYALQQNLLGAFAWDEITDQQKSYNCFNQFASSIGGTPTSNPAPTSSPTPPSNPSSSPTPPSSSTPPPSSTAPSSSCPGAQAISYTTLASSPAPTYQGERTKVTATYSAACAQSGAILSVSLTDSSGKVLWTHNVTNVTLKGGSAQQSTSYAWTVSPGRASGAYTLSVTLLNASGNPLPAANGSIASAGQMSALTIDASTHLTNTPCTVVINGQTHTGHCTGVLMP